MFIFFFSKTVLIGGQKKKLQITLTLEYHYIHTLRVSNLMMLLRNAISLATTIYPDAH